MRAILSAAATAVIVLVVSGTVGAKELKFDTTVPSTTSLGKSVEDGLIPGVAKASGGKLTVAADNREVVSDMTPPDITEPWIISFTWRRSR